MWKVTCKCGHSGDWFSFAAHGLKPNQWRCVACDCAWEVRKDGVRVLRQPRPQKAAA
jgi:hypothetical protein